MSFNVDISAPTESEILHNKSNGNFKDNTKKEDNSVDISEEIDFVTRNVTCCWNDTFNTRPKLSSGRRLMKRSIGFQRERCNSELHLSSPVRRYSNISSSSRSEPSLNQLLTSYKVPNFENFSLLATGISNSFKTFNSKTFSKEMLVIFDNKCLRNEETTLKYSDNLRDWKCVYDNHSGIISNWYTQGDRVENDFSHLVPLTFSPLDEISKPISCTDAEESSSLSKIRGKCSDTFYSENHGSKNYNLPPLDRNSKKRSINVFANYKRNDSYYFAVSSNNFRCQLSDTVPAQNNIIHPHERTECKEFIPTEFFESNIDEICTSDSQKQERDKDRKGKKRSKSLKRKFTFKSRSKLQEEIFNEKGDITSSFLDVSIAAPMNIPLCAKGSSEFPLEVGKEQMRENSFRKSWTQVLCPRRKVYKK